MFHEGCSIGKGACLGSEVVLDDWVQWRNVDSIGRESTIEKGLVEVLPGWIEVVLHPYVLLYFVIYLPTQHHLVDQSTHQFVLALRGLLEGIKGIVTNILNSGQFDEVEHLPVGSAMGDEDDHARIHSILEISGDIASNGILVE